MSNAGAVPVACDPHGPCLTCGEYGGQHEPACVCAPIRVGRQWVWSDDRSGAYAMEEGVLVWAPFDQRDGRFDWENVVQVDFFSISEDESGEAKRAEALLTGLVEIHG